MEQKKGSEILSKFIYEITEDKSICELILKNQYDIFKEHQILNGKGRIDLFIKDSKNEFVIVIENKIYADVGVKSVSEKGKITETQLTYYQKYVEENFKNYKQYFILLSFKEVEDNFDRGKFVLTNYDGLIEILNTVEISDNILKEYKNLLFYLTKMDYNREYLVDLIADIKSEETKDISLSNLELINTYYE